MFNRIKLFVYNVGMDVKFVNSKDAQNAEALISLELLKQLLILINHLLLVVFVNGQTQLVVMFKDLLHVNNPTSLLIENVNPAIRLLQNVNNVSPTNV